MSEYDGSVHWHNRLLSGTVNAKKLTVKKKDQGLLPIHVFIPHVKADTPGHRMLPYWIQIQKEDWIC